jgi:hypothetical protein
MDQLWLAWCCACYATEGRAAESLDVLMFGVVAQVPAGALTEAFNASVM